MEYKPLVWPDPPVPDVVFKLWVEARLRAMQTEKNEMEESPDEARDREIRWLQESADHDRKLASELAERVVKLEALVYMGRRAD